MNQERNYKLYVHIAPNGKRYYGITKQKPERRWGGQGQGYKDNQYFTRAINKYGWDNIEHIVIHNDLTEHEAELLEQYMIQWYDTANRNNGYNISLGGESGNGYKHSEEWKIEQSKRLSGEKHPMYGKQLSEETRKKISEARKGKKYPRHGKTSKLDSRAKAVICTTTGQVFYSIREANAFYNMPMKNSKISACCKDKRKSAGKTPDGKKMVWRYIDIIEL